MGFLDVIKGLFGGAASQVQQQVDNATQGSHAQQHAHAHAHVEEDQEEEAEAAEAFDTARFDPEDEDGFFNAVLHMESEGEGGGTDASRAEIMAKYGIRDRSHWQTVKESVYTVLARKHGSMDAVMQQETNFRMGQMQRRMQGATAAKAASGELNPVEGVTLEAWAAINAAIVQGANLEDLLKGGGIDQARWDRAKGEWEARMARDTTFAIAQIYGNAFQNASKGKYAEYAREANAARAANRELSMQPPLSLEQYYDIMFEQAYASKQGKDAAQALKDMGLSVVDWCDLSSFMGYHFYRTAGLKNREYSDLLAKTQAKFEAKYPGVKADVDISF